MDTRDKPPRPPWSPATDDPNRARKLPSALSRFHVGSSDLSVRGEPEPVAIVEPSQAHGVLYQLSSAYRSPSPYAWAAVAALAVTLLTDIAVLVTAFVTRGTLGHLTYATYQQTVGTLASLVVARTALSCVSGLAVMAWLARSYANLNAFHTEGLFSNPILAAVGCLPFVNLYFPQVAFQEVWQASDSRLPFSNPHAWRRGRKSLLVFAWWALFFIATAAYVAASVVDAAGGRQINSALKIFGFSFNILSTVAAIAVVLTLTGRQEERYYALADAAGRYNY